MKSPHGDLCEVKIGLCIWAIFMTGKDGLRVLF